MRYKKPQPEARRELGAAAAAMMQQAAALNMMQGHKHTHIPHANIACKGQVS